MTQPVITMTAPGHDCSMHRSQSKPKDLAVPIGDDDGKSVKKKMEPVHIIPRWVQLLMLSAAVFFFYLGYGYMQELIFRLPGMKPFGWYLTLVQFALYSFCGYAEMKVSHTADRKIPLLVYMQLAFYTVGTMGLSNASVGYLNYPTQVIFKCCKLIPVLIGGILIQGKKYGAIDFMAAVCMSGGLILFTLADSKVSPIFDFTGYMLISGALVFDAVIGNVQEKQMKAYGASNNEVVFYSYSIGCVYILIGTLITGEFFEAFVFFAQHPWETYGYAVVFGCAGYLGVNVVLTLVKQFDAFVAVTVTTCRKAITIVLSFLLFSKPFTPQYLWAGMIVLFGIYMNVYNKNYDRWNAAGASAVKWLITRLQQRSIARSSPSKSVMQV